MRENAPCDPDATIQFTFNSGINCKTWFLESILHRGETDSENVLYYRLVETMTVESNIFRAITVTVDPKIYEHCLQFLQDNQITIFYWFNVLVNDYASVEQLIITKMKDDFHFTVMCSMPDIHSADPDCEYVPTILVGSEKDLHEVWISVAKLVTMMPEEEVDELFTIE
jgi:hypothetical protein